MSGARRWLGYLALVVAFSVACGWLASWQFGRNEEAAERIRQIEENWDSAPVPLAAVLASHEAMGVFGPGDHGSTFAGSPLVTAVANAVLAQVNQPEFLAGVAQKGAYLRERLEELNSPLITEVRGKGLMIGMDLTIPASQIVDAGYRHGLLLVNAGPSTLRLVPPLIISHAEIDTLIERLTAVFTEVQEAQ